MISRGVISIIHQENFRKNGRLCFQTARVHIDYVLYRKNVVAIVLVPQEDELEASLCDAYEIAIYIKKIREERKIPVTAFLRNTVFNSGYIIACAADTIVIDPSTQLNIEACTGLIEMIDNLRPNSAIPARHVLPEESSVSLIGRHAVKGLFVDRVDSYVGYVVDELQGELYSVDDAHYGFAGVTL